MLIISFRGVLRNKLLKLNPYRGAIGVRVSMKIKLPYVIEVARARTSYEYVSLSVMYDSSIFLRRFSALHIYMVYKNW